MKDEILKKIKKLMALSKSPNANEAALALKKAQALMSKHGVKNEDLLFSDISSYYGTAIRSANPPYYVSLLVQTITDIFECSFYWHTKREFCSTTGRWKYRTYPTIIGFSPNQELCGYCYDNLYRQLKRDRENFSSGYRSNHKKTVAKDAYAEGWVMAIRKQVIHLIPEKEEMTAKDEHGLIITNPLAAYIEDTCTGEAKLNRREGSMDDIIKGYDDGSKVQVNKAVQHNNNQMALH